MEPILQNQETEKTIQTPKLKTVKYVIAWVTWCINLVGAVIEHIRNNPVPKKTDYEA